MNRSDTVFFLTGAAALAYESVWIRLLARLLGSDAGGLAVVLAVFMGGMGLGALCFAPLARRTLRPARLFAGLELALGIWAALSPWMLELVGPLESFPTRAFFAALFLAPPTLAMGATFPLMGRLTIASAAETGSATSAFYGANTLGAATGALLAPLALMPLFGLSGALMAAAVLDFVAAGLALSWLSAPAGTTTAVKATDASKGPGADPYLMAVFLMGFAGLGLEVLLVRLLVTVTGASVYAYAIVLFVFLAGIGIGSRQLVTKDGAGERGPRAGPRCFQLAALGLPALTLAGLCALRWQLGEADLFGSLQNRMPETTGLVRLWATHVLLAAVALLPPAIALGVALPSAVTALADRHPASPRETCLGRVYAFNTAGALCGSLVTAFVLLPSAGPRLGLVAVLAAAWLAVLFAPPRRLGAAGIGLAVALGLGTVVLGPGDRGQSPVARLYLAHDAHATVAVEESPDGEQLVRSLRVNGKVVATSVPVDLRLQRLLAHVPALLHGHVERALVIGLGTGMTAGALLDHESLARLDIHEISAAVPGAAREFAAWNGGVVDDERTHLRIADGRHALATSDERWDLITSDPIHPWTRGSSDLYALEHFENMAAHLREGGVASQWLPLYQLSESDVKTVVATWIAAFPHTSAWLTAYDLALIGSTAPLPGESAPAELELPPRVASSLGDAGVASAPGLAALLVADDAALRALAAGVEPMSDDRPVLEFRAPLSFLAGYSTEILRWAGREEFVASLPEASREHGREIRQILAEFLAAIPSGMGVAARRYGEDLMSLPQH